MASISTSHTQTQSPAIPIFKEQKKKKRHTHTQTPFSSIDFFLHTKLRLFHSHVQPFRSAIIFMVQTFRNSTSDFVCARARVCRCVFVSEQQSNTISQNKSNFHLTHAVNVIFLLFTTLIQFCFHFRCRSKFCVFMLFSSSSFFE